MELNDWSDEPKPSDYEHFLDYEDAWHKYMAPKQSKESIYWDGQFDEIPFINWDEMLENKKKNARTQDSSGGDSGP